MNLEHTGERMVVEHYSSSIEDYVVYLMHMATYRYALQYVEGKRVLDCGCGSGYGARLMAGRAATVDAVDVAEDAIAHARQAFGHPNLRFHGINPLRPLPFADETFDTVASFQVIEHVTDVDHYLAEINRVLAPGGRLLVATPDRRERLLPGQRPWNRWHLREYDPATLSAALQRHFPQVQMLTMGGRRDVIDVELRRYRRLKWMTLPMTLPIYPDSLRVALLNMLHALRRRDRTKAAALSFDFDESTIEIGEGLAPSLNLVAIASKGGRTAP